MLAAVRWPLRSLTAAAVWRAPKRPAGRCVLCCAALTAAAALRLVQCPRICSWRGASVAPFLASAHTDAGAAAEAAAPWAAARLLPDSFAPTALLTHYKLYLLLENIRQKSTLDSIPMRGARRIRL